MAALPEHYEVVKGGNSELIDTERKIEGPISG